MDFISTIKNSFVLNTNNNNKSQDDHKTSYKKDIKVNTEMNKIKAQLENQSTYMDYIRAGFIIAAVGASFKRLYLIVLELLFMIFATIQFLVIDHKIIINDGSLENIEQKWSKFPVFYALMLTLVIFIEYKKHMSDSKYKKSPKEKGDYFYRMRDFFD